MDRLTIRANTPIQACGAAILKVSLGNLWKELSAVSEDEARLAGCVHDEVICLVREDKAEKWKAIVKRCMEKAEARWLGDVPAIADVNVGRDWASTH